MKTCCFRLRTIKTILLVLILGGITNLGHSAQYYWVGGDGEWSDLTHWATTSGGGTFHTIVPTPLDDVIIDVNSFPGAGGTLTMNFAGAVKSLTVNHLFTNLVFDFNAAFSVEHGGIDIIGNVTWTQEDGLDVKGGGFHLGPNSSYTRVGTQVFRVYEGDMVIDTNSTFTHSGQLRIDTGNVILKSHASLTKDNGGGAFEVPLGYFKTEDSTSISDNNQHITFGKGMMLGYDCYFYDHRGNLTVQDSGIFMDTLSEYYHDYETITVYDSMRLDSGSSFRTRHHFNLYNTDLILKEGSSFRHEHNYNNVDIKHGTIVMDSSATYYQARGRLYIRDKGWTIPKGAIVQCYADEKYVYGGDFVVEGGGANVIISRNWMDIYDGGIIFDTTGGTTINNTIYYRLRPRTTAAYNIKSSGINLRGLYFDQTNHNTTYTLQDDLKATVNYIQIDRNKLISNGYNIHAHRLYAHNTQGALDLSGTDTVWINENVYFDQNAATDIIIDEAVFVFLGNNQHQFYCGDRDYNNIICETGSNHFYMYDNGTFDTIWCDRTSSGQFQIHGTKTVKDIYHTTTGNGRFYQNGTLNCDDISSKGSNMDFEVHGAINCDDIDLEHTSASQSFPAIHIAGAVNMDDFIYTSTPQVRSSLRTYGNSVFDTLDVGDRIFEWTIGDNRTQTANWISDLDGECDRTILINCNTIGGLGKISMATGTLNGDYLRLQDNEVLGGATFNATNTLDFGNVTGWTFVPVAAQDFYWIGNDGDWNDATAWSFSSGGPTANCVPSRVDNVFFDANSFSATGQYCTINVPAECNNMNWDNIENGAGMDGAEILDIYGSLKLDEVMNFNHTGGVDFWSHKTGNTIATEGIHMRNLNFRRDSAVNGAWTVTDSMYCDHFIMHNGKVTLGTTGEFRTTRLQLVSNQDTLIGAGGNFNVDEHFYCYGWVEMMGGNLDVQNNMQTNGNTKFDQGNGGKITILGEARWDGGTVKCGGGDVDVTSNMRLRGNVNMTSNGANFKCDQFNNDQSATLDFTGTATIEARYHRFQIHTSTNLTIDTADVYLNSRARNHHWFYGGNQTYNNVYISYTQNDGHQLLMYHNNTVDSLFINYNGTHLITWDGNWNIDYAELNFNRNGGNPYVNVNHTKNIDEMVFYAKYPNVNTRIYLKGNHVMDTLNINDVRTTYIQSGRTITTDIFTYEKNCYTQQLNNLFAESGTGHLSVLDTAYLSYLNVKSINATTSTDTVSVTNGVDIGGNTKFKFVGGTNFYWISGTGNMNDTTHWSYTSGGPIAGCLPGANDNVFFDINSFTAPGQQVNLSGNCKNMVWNNVNNPIASGSVSVYGSLTVAPNVTWANTGSIVFRSSEPGNTITTNGVTLRQVTFQPHIGHDGEWTLLDDLDLYHNLYLNGGKFISNGKNVSVLNLLNDVDHSNIHMDFTGTDELIITGRYFRAKNSTTVMMENTDVTFASRNYERFTFEGGNNTYRDVSMTYTGNHSNNRIDISGNNTFRDIMVSHTNGGQGTYTFNGNSTYRNVSISTMGYPNLTFNGNSTYNDIDIIYDNPTTDVPDIIFNGQNDVNVMSITSTGNGGPWIYLNDENEFLDLVAAGLGTRLYLKEGKTQTVEGTIGLGNGSFPLRIQSQSPGDTAMIYKSEGEVCLDFVLMQDIAGHSDLDGGGNMKTDFFAGTSSVDLGNNPNWQFTSCLGYYWVGGTGNWSDASGHWATSSGGSTFHAAPPLSTENVYFDLNSFTGTDQVVTVDVPVATCRNMTWQSAVFNPTLAGNTVIEVHNELELIGAMNQEFTGVWKMEADTSTSMNTAGLPMTDLEFNGGNSGDGQWTLQNALNVSNDLDFNNGTLITNDKDITTKNFNSTTDSTRSLQLGASTVTIDSGMWNPATLTDLTLVEGTSTIVMRGEGSTSTFNGNSLIYNNLRIETNTTTTSTVLDTNTFNIVTLEEGVTLIADTATQTMNDLVADGTCGQLINIESVDPGTASIFSIASGTIDVSFTAITDNTATGGATFNADFSDDNGGNTGWNFTSVPQLVVDIDTGKVDCILNNDGWAEVVSVTGGVNPYAYLWSTSESTARIENLIPGNYTVTITDSIGCEYIEDVAVVNNPSYLVGVPFTMSADKICLGTSIDFTAGDPVDSVGSHKWTFGDFNTSTLKDPSHTYGAFGSYEVSLSYVDTFGCPAIVYDSVFVSDIEAIITHTDIACFGDDDGTITITLSKGFEPYSYSIDGGATYQSSGSYTNLTPGMYDVTAKDAFNCEVAQVTIDISEPASAVSFSVDSTGVSCSGEDDGQIVITASGGTPPYNYTINNGIAYFPSNTFNDLVEGTYNVKVRDANNCETVAEVVTIGVEDIINPSITCPTNITVNSVANCEAAVTVPVPATSDACGILSVVNDYNGTGDASDTYPGGVTTVVWTVTDVNNNVDSCTMTVTVTDNVAPMADCKDITVYLDNSGDASIVGSDVNDMSTDDCSIVSYAITAGQDTYDCDDVGMSFAVTMTVTDVGGNTDDCTANVTVEDTISPMAICQDITVSLDASGTATITPAQVNDGSNDNCTVEANLSLSLSKTTFDCDDIVGPPSWEYVGTNGFSAGASIYQSIAIDGGEPYVAYRDDANSQKTTVMKYNGTNWINVGTPGFSAGGSAWHSLAFEGGEPYVAYSDDANFSQLTVMKYNGTSWVNVGSPGFSSGISSYASLAFEGGEPYVAYRSNGDGHKISVMKYNGTSWVNVGSPGFSTAYSDNSSLAFYNGEPYVAYRDGGNGNKTSVKKYDGSNWVIVGSLGFSAGSANYQSLAFIGSEPHVAYSDASVGNKATVMKYNGANWVNVGSAGFSAGNTDYISLAVEGGEPYVAYRDGVNSHRTTVMKFDGSNWMNVGSIGFSDVSSHYQSLAIDNGEPFVAYRNGSAGHKTSVMKFPDNTIKTTLTVEDEEGNSSSCEATVTVEDNMDPVTPTLADVTGQCTATATAPTTTDNCAGTVTGTTSDPLTYNTQGTHVIEWTFDDGNGNVIMVNQNVVIDDTEDPATPTLADVTGQCDATATAPTTTDNCAGTVTGTTSDPLTYNTQGTHVIEWTFNDGNGNIIMVNQNVVIDDTEDPATPTLADVTGQCTATATAPTTTDNCAGTVTGTTSDPLTYNTQGTHVIEWTFDDGNGNLIMVNQNVVVDDTEPPMAICQDITVSLDASGNATITPAQVNDGSNDNCTVEANLSLSLSKTTFNCDEIGGYPEDWVNVGNADFSSSYTAGESLAFDGSTPYVAFRDPGNGSRMSVMKYDGTNWVYVGMPGFSSTNTSSVSFRSEGLAFNNGTPYVAFTEGASGNRATVMKFDGTNWVVVGTAGFSAASAHYISLDFESNEPFVAYSDHSQGQKTTVMKYDGTNWVNVGSVGFSAGVSIYQSLAFHNGEPYVAYKDDGNSSKATVMKYDGTNWLNVGSAGFSGGEARYVSLAFHSGEPHVAYQDWANGRMTTVMKYDGTNWVNVGSAGFSAGVSSYQSLAFENGEPHVAYADGGSANKSSVMKYNGTNWVNLGSPGFSHLVSETQSLKFYNGEAYVAYSNGSNGKTTVKKFSSEPITTILTVSDEEGNSSTCTATVTVEDNMDPATPTLADVTGQCDATATAPTTTDNCAGTVTGTTSDPLTYNTQGTHVIEWTFDDGNGNVIMVNQNVVIDDTEDPATPTLADVTGQCDATATAPTTTDNCAGTVTGTTSNPLTYNTQGTHVIEWTFDDGNGNIIMVNQNVVIDDTEDPATPTLADVTGQCTATATAPTTTDNCAGTVTGTTSDPLTYNTQGTHVIEWTFDDGNGNIIMVNQNVVIDDTEDPATPTLADVTGQCDATATAPTTTDNCAGTVTGTTSDPLTYNTQGTHVIEWTFDDGNGNVIMVNQNVVIDDTEDPATPTLADVTGQCDATATAPTTTDNCAGTVTGTTSDPLTYNTQGTHVIEWTFDDGNGNVIMVNQNVVIDDTEDPTTPTLADVTGQCDATATAPTTTDNCAGTVTGTTSDPLTYNTQGTHVIEWTFDDGNGNVIMVNQNVVIDDTEDPATPTLADVTGECSATAIAPTTTDNCTGTVTGTTSDPLTYTDQGTYVIEWTFDDGNGNSIMANQNVIVDDVTDPQAECKALITVELDVNGAATITVADIDDGSTDNCNIASKTLSKTSFDCDDIGNNSVVLTVKDDADNEDNCTTIVNVEDNINPVASCKNITIALDANGEANITGSSVNDISSDACGIQSMTVSPDEFDCGDVGVNTVTLTVTDNNGNTATCSATVTVEDDTNPVANCQDVTIQLDASGNATLTAGQVNNNSSDACGIKSLSINQTSFDCDDVGANTITLTVTDENDNVSTCMSTVTVEDTENPVADCKDITVQLDASGNATVVAADINDGSSDNCNVASVVITSGQTSFDCGDVGQIFTLTLTVKDDYDNEDDCIAQVTVKDDTNPCCDAPEAMCKDITVQLGAGGSVTILPADVDNGSTADCGLQSKTLDEDTWDCTEIGTHTVTLTVTDVNNETSTCTSSVTVEDDTDPVIVCHSNIAVNNTSGLCGAVVNYTAPSASDNCSGVSITQTDGTGLSSGSTFPVGTTTLEYTATDASGNTDVCSFDVTVSDNENPVASCKNITVQLDGNGNATITAADVDDVSTDNCGIANRSIDISSFNCSNVGTNNVTLTIEDIHGNTAMCTAVVTVEDTEAPNAECQSIIVHLDENGQATITADDIDDGSTDNCNIASRTLNKTSFDCSDLGANLVTLTVKDDYDNEDDCTILIFVEDNIAPVASCQDLTVFLDSNGDASITPSQVDNGSTDNCTSPANLTLSLSQSTFDCNDVNTAPSSWVNVGNAGFSAGDATYESLAFHNGEPYVAYQDVANGSKTTVMKYDGANWVNVGSAGFSAGLATYQSLAFYNGEPYVAYSDDANSKKATVMKFDGTNWVNVGSAGFSAARAVYLSLAFENGEPYVAYRDNGNGHMTTVMKYDGSNWVNVGTPGFSVGLSVYQSLAFYNGEPYVAYSDYGISRKASVMKYDGSNWVNIGTAGFSADRADYISLAFHNGEPHVAFNDIGNGPGTTVMKYDGSSWVNVGNPAFSAGGAQYQSLAFHNGEPYVAYSDHGHSQEATVMKYDGSNWVNVGSAAFTPDISIYQSLAFYNGEPYVAFQDYANSQKATVMKYLNTDITTTLTVEDEEGNTSTCSAKITVRDTVSPVASCQDITVYLDANGDASIVVADIDNGSSDACGIASRSIDISSFNCGDVGANTVELTVTDNNGNISTCTSTVTVQDTVSPIAICQDITVFLDANGDATIVAGDLDNGSNDACGIDTRTLDISAFDCGDVGANTVELTVTDNNGNSSTCSSTVTVQDTVSPIAICQDITVQLDANGDASIVSADINNGSHDACGIATLGLSKYDFDCGDLGSNTVTLNVTDNNGNASTCTSTVTVQDTVSPVATCQDITVQLDANGDATIVAADVDNGSSDACGIDTRTLDISAFDCGDIGANTVVLTVTDNNGNSSTCSSTVTVADTVSPVATCQDITVQLDVNGDATIVAGDIDNGSSDACGIDTRTLDISAFDCGDIGTNTVELTVTDNNGNSSSCSSTVTVQDTVPPVAICQDITVHLDANGDATIVAADVDNGSNDACGIEELTIDLTIFDCTDVGTHTVTLTAKDMNGNTATCTATVTVSDTTSPEAICKNIVVGLDGSGVASISPNDIDDGSNDACGVNLSIDVSSFDCDDLGANTVTLTVTDDNGNVSTCTSTVTIEDNVPPVYDNPFLPVINVECSVTLTPPTATDNCAGTVTATTNDPLTYDQQGTYTVTWDYDDGNGNMASQMQTVNVNDVTSPQISVNCPNDMFLCGEQTVTWTEPEATDNCAGLMVSSNYSPGDNFTVGVHTVTYDFTDVGGNMVSCSFDVTIYEKPDVTVSQSQLPDFCQGTSLLEAMVLNENDLEPVITYAWSDGLGNEAEATAFSNGTYSVSVTDGNNCETVVSTVVDEEETEILSSYGLLANIQVKTKRSIISGGGIGVYGTNKKARILNSSLVNTFVKAPVIQVRSGSSVAREVIGEANVGLPTFISNTSNCNSNVVVQPGQTVVLTGNDYGKITVKSDGVLIVDSPEWYVRQIDMKSNSEIIFDQPTVVMVKTNVSLANSCIVNISGEAVRFFIQTTFNVKKGSDFSGHVYAKGKIHAKAASNSDQTYMKGSFISENIIQSDNFVNWDWAMFCNGNPVVGPPTGCGSGNLVVLEKEEREIENGQTESARDIVQEVGLSPNPTKGPFELDMTDYLGQEVEINIYDYMGKRVESFKEKVLREGEIAFDLSDYPGVTYQIEIIVDGNEKITRKLVVLRP